MGKNIQTSRKIGKELSEAKEELGRKLDSGGEWPPNFCPECNGHDFEEFEAYQSKGVTCKNCGWSDTDPRHYYGPNTY